MAGCHILVWTDVHPSGLVQQGRCATASGPAVSSARAASRGGDPQALGTTAAVRGTTVLSLIWRGASEPRPSATTMASSPAWRTRSAGGLTNARPPRLTDSRVALWSLRSRAETV